MDITDVERSVCNRLTPGTKVIIRGLEEFQFTLRTSVPNNFGNLVDSCINCSVNDMKTNYKQQPINWINTWIA